MIEKAIEKITEQQKSYTEEDKVYWIAEQLKEICRTGKDNAELIFNDLSNPDMSIKNAEKKVEEYARKHGGCCPYQVAGRILREFYGLSEETSAEKFQSATINLADFM